MSFRKKMIVLFSCFMVLGFANFLLFILNDQSALGTAINVAGRQRMLSQRITKEALMLISASDEVEQDKIRKELSWSINTFADSLEALRNSGDVKNMGTVPSPITQRTIDAGNALQNEWNEFKKHCTILMDRNSTAEGRRDATDKMLITNIPLLKKAHALTGSLAADSNEIAERMWKYQLFGNILMGALILFAIFFIVLPVGRRLIEITKIADRFAKGISEQDKLSQLVSRDEVGQLAESFYNMQKVQTERIVIAENISKGDLSQDVEIVSDEDMFGKSLQNMTAGLRNLIFSITTASSQTAEMANAISSSSQSLAQGATEQAATLEEINSSMDLVSSQTSTNANNASQANSLAIQSRESAEEGNAQIEQMLSAMDEINESSREISKIIKVIDDIAFQTNLLALNAAVEAARAGKHGKGFAVVAQEVRTLANRSAKAANETGELIEGSIRKVENGTTIADKTAKSLNKIAESIKKVSGLVSEIAESSNEQSQGTGQINEGLNQLNEVTQMTAEASENTSTSAISLSLEANKLREMVSIFKIETEESNAESEIESDALEDLPAAIETGSSIELSCL